MNRLILAIIVVLPTAAPLVNAATRARDLGIPFDGTPGAFNAITDVEGVWVGHTTLIEGEGDLVVGEGPVRTGVTAILPTGRTYRPVYAATGSLNGNGEMTGAAWIEESGLLEEPILVTNTRSVGVVHDAVWDWRRANGYHDQTSKFGWAALPVVAETWDGRLNDIHGGHVKRTHVFSALNSARSGAVAEGNVGGGTGMVCHRFKGGIGTSSRSTSAGYTVGVLVQANYGTRESLSITGVPVGREITDLMPEISSIDPPGEGNSIIVVVATDAPLLPHQLKRLTKRVPLGIGRVGGYGRNSSGDLFLAFTTARSETSNDSNVRLAPSLNNDAMDPLMLATVEATEEAIVNSMVAATTMTGINGNTVHALPHERLQEVLRRYNRIGRDSN
jgi:L-aminopeptidase/D-esterase-like protein